MTTCEPHPSAPAWFRQAIAQAPRRRRLSVEGARLDVLSWGEPGAPDVVLLPGHAAHAEWWSFIAPFLAADRKVTTFSWSGMGGSDWREGYSVEQYARELTAVAKAEAVFERGQPTFIAHSFGGVPLLHAARTIGHRMNRAVLIDTLLKPSRGPRRGKGGDRAHVVRANPDELMPRFRFSPPQPCANAYAIDWIARRGMTEVTAPDGTQGVRWSFDPNSWDRLVTEDVDDVVADPPCPLAFISGAESALVTPSAVAFARSIAPAGTPFAVIPEAGHHVLVDQPVALIAALQLLIAPAETRHG